MSGKSVSIVLIGSKTAGRKWINYEIEKTWKKGKGLLGIYVPNLKDKNKEQSEKGRNPFSCLLVDGKSLSTIVKVYDPPCRISTHVYNYIKDNLADWIETAISIRNNND